MVKRHYEEDMANYKKIIVLDQVGIGRSFSHVGDSYGDAMKEREEFRTSL
jgi:hypothetical protein